MTDLQSSGRYADLPGVRVWYVDSGGSGEPVILLHSTTATSVNWTPQIDALSRAGYRAIAPDRKGWGKSTPTATERKDLTGADDLEALADHLSLDQFHLVAVAGGGLIAIDYAAWHPERVLSLVVGSCTGSMTEKEIVEFSERIAIPDGVKVARYYTDVGATYRGTNAEGIALWREIEKTARQPGAPRVHTRTPNDYAKFERLTTPTLVLAGGEDWVAPAALMRLWAKRVKGAELAVIPEAGHSIAWEQPDLFSRKVLEFIGRHGRNR